MGIRNYTIFDLETGEIKRNISCLESDIALNINENEAYLEGFYNWKIEYIVKGKIVTRPVFKISLTSNTITANGLDSVVLSEIPRNTKIYCYRGRILEDAIKVDDSTLEFTTEVPGKYVLKFENFPYQEMEVEIDAT